MESRTRFASARVVSDEILQLNRPSEVDAMQKELIYVENWRFSVAVC
jgi:hypothetical protein